MDHRRIIPPDFFPAMNPPSPEPQWVRQLHEDEAVWAAFERRRAVREALAALAHPRTGARAFTPEEMDRLDLLAAECEVGRVVKAHGHWADGAR